MVPSVHVWDSEWDSGSVAASVEPWVHGSDWEWDSESDSVWVDWSVPSRVPVRVLERVPETVRHWVTERELRWDYR